MLTILFFLLLFLTLKFCLCYPSYVNPGSSSLIFLFFSSIVWIPPFFILRMVPSLLKKRLLMAEISAAEGFEKLSCFSDVLVFFFFRLLLQIFPGTCRFPFLQGFWFIFDLIVLFLPLFFFLSLWALHIFLRYILFLYSGCIFLLFLSESQILLFIFRK